MIDTWEISLTKYKSVQDLMSLLMELLGMTYQNESSLLNLYVSCFVLLHEQLKLTHQMKVQYKTTLKLMFPIF